jgi:predicted transcriptional regulator
MAILISLPPDLEAKLQAKAERQGQDIAVVAADLLSDMLEWDDDDTEAAIQGIQRGLEDFEAGRFRDFSDFAVEQQRKYDYREYRSPCSSYSSHSPFCQTKIGSGIGAISRAGAKLMSSQAALDHVLSLTQCCLIRVRHNGR